MTSVYISNENIQVIIGSKSGSSLNIKKVVTEEIGGDYIINGVITDDTALSTRIGEIWKANKLPKSGIKLLLESGSVSTKMLSLPNLNERYLMKLIKESFSDMDVESPVYDYRTLGPSEEGGISVMACMAESSFVQKYIKLFSDAGIKLENIDLAVSGQMKLARFSKSLSEKTYTLMYIDGNTVSQFLFVSGEYRFSKRQRMLYNRGTPELADEVLRMISTLLQFKKSEHIAEELTDIYLCGFSDEEINSVGLMYENLSVSGMPDLPEIKAQNADKAKLSECVLALANML